MHIDTNKFHLSLRKNFFPWRVAEHWNRLVKELVESPFLVTFQTYLDVFCVTCFR